MITDQLAVEIAHLGVVRDSSVAGTLRRVTELAARAVAGCAGATSVRWSRCSSGTADLSTSPEPLLTTASHPDLAEVVDVQLARREGPIFDAASNHVPVSCQDTLAETRWPMPIGAMLRRGVRCFTTIPHENRGMLVTLTLYGVMPRVLDPNRMAMAALLLAQGGAVVHNTAEYDHAHRTATQLREAVASRAVVNQAKGILMHALGCDAETAFGKLRRISQTRHVKLTAIAQRIVAGHELPGDPERPRG